MRQIIPRNPLLLWCPTPPGPARMWGPELSRRSLRKILENPSLLSTRPVRAVRSAGRNWPIRSLTDTISGMINLPHLPSAILDPERKATFKGEDIVPIISQALDPTTVSVLPDSPWKTLKELIDDAKKRPGQITAGIVGYLQDDEIGYLQLAEAAGFQMRLVYFDGAAPAITALLGKHVDVLYCTVADLFTQWKAGRIRILTIMDKERTKFYPDLPTTAELGFPGVISASTRGIAAPKGVPAPIMKKLQEVFQEVDAE